MGAIGAYQGIMRSRGTPFTPADARTRLRTTGSPQQDAPGRPATQRIGNRPNLQALVGKGIFKEKGEKNEINDQKLEKFEQKEIKEAKLEKNEAKDQKLEKIERKELKEAKLEKNEVNDQKAEKVEKEGKEIKLEKVEITEGGRKRIGVEGGGKGLVEGGILGRGGIRERVQGGPGSESVEDRLNRLEGTIVELTHFIAGELRPDLSQGALSHETDVAGLSAQLEKDAVDAKQAKDMKDVEKTADV